MIRSRSTSYLRFGIGLLLSSLFGRTAFAIGGPPLPMPFGLEVNPSCHSTTIQWTASGAPASFQYQLTRGSMLVAAGPSATPSLTLTDLASDSYSIAIKAVAGGGIFSDSPWSAPMAFVVPPCIVCSAPSIQLAPAVPSILWPPSGKMVPVSVQGTLSSRCDLLQAKYAVKSGSALVMSGPVTVSDDGSFTINVSLLAARFGQEKQGVSYTITVEATNAGGTSTSAPVVVTVPHDNGDQ